MLRSTPYGSMYFLHSWIGVLAGLVAAGMLLAALSSAHAFFPGSNFEARRHAYIDDQGHMWANDSADMRVRMPLCAWLETTLEAKQQGLPSSQWDTWKPYSWTDPATGAVKQRSQLISDGIEYWTNQGWYTGALPGALTVPRISFQYYQDPATRVVVSSADVQKLEQRMYELGSNVLNSSNNVWCAVANWNFPGIVGAYLYNSRIQDVGSAPFPPPDPDYHCPGPYISYNGHSYVGGNSYGLQPDVIALQEASDSRKHGSVPQRIADALGYQMVFEPATHTSSGSVSWIG